jgi:peptidyl-prolyl cis-trans isomerase C
MQRLVVLVLSVALAGLGSACTQPAGGGGTQKGPQVSKPGDPTPLAKIGDVTITVGEFENRINKQSPYIRARYSSLERKKEFLDNLVRFETLAAEAARKGYDKDEEVVRTMKQVMIQKLMRDEFDKKIKLEDISEADCRKFYDEKKDEYNKPEEVRVSHILVPTEAKAKEVIAKYNELNNKEKGQDARHFRELVNQYSTDDAMNKQRGGDLSFFAQNSTQWPKEVVEAAFKLKNIGDISAPVKSAKGWHVLKLTGRRKAINRTFEEVKRQIQNRLYRDKRQKAQEDYINELKKKANVQLFEDKLAQVKIDTTPGTGMMGFPPGHPGMRPGMGGRPGMGMRPGMGGHPGMGGPHRGMPGVRPVPGAPAPKLPVAPKAPAPAKAATK